MKSYFCVAREAEAEKIIERSRFIAYTCQTPTDDDARAFIERIRKMHPFATHNCYAYIAEQGAVMRFSDDGEPQGTAGMPILDVIKNKNLVNTAVVVTRYFGGVKLGAGGLVRAYSASTADVLETCKIEEHVFSCVLKITFDYDKYSSFLKFCENRKCEVLERQFAGGVSVCVAVPEEERDKFVSSLTDYLAGKVSIETKDNAYTVFKGE